MFNIFYNTLYNIINDNVPAYKHIKNKKTYPKYILRLKVKCLKYYKTRLDSHNNFINWKNIKKLLDYNITKLTIDREKLILSSNDKSRFYNYINSRCSSFSTIGPIKSDDNTYIFSDTVKSNILNNQFSSVFINDNDNIPHLSPPKHNSTINNFLFYRHNIRKHLINLSLSCTLPPDNIPSIFFKQFSYELSIPLTILFNKTLSAGVCPDIWKVSYIVPIFKKGDPSNSFITIYTTIYFIENYRPISITSIMSRVFERILVEEINFYLERNSLISDSQFGFRHKKSVELQLLNCYIKWITTIDKGSIIDIIYFDYARVFKVSHNKLLVKLTKRVNNQMSDTIKIISGVPQGSVIGYLLFLIYINGLVEVIDKDISINLFADDTKLSCISNDINHRYKLQYNIDKFYEWSNSWKLENSAKKSTSLTLGTTNKPLYTINNSKLSIIS